MHRPFSELNRESFNFEPKDTSPERLSQKPLDIMARSILEQSPELKTKIVETMSMLSEYNEPLPVIHITSKAIKTEQGVKQLDFIENIKTKGFKARHTNVGAFVQRQEKPVLAKADYFRNNPEEFIKSFWLFLQRYSHHGSRTNKDTLGDSRDSGDAEPVMIVIDGDIRIARGTDYDDHFIMDEPVGKEKIIGYIDLLRYSPYREHLGELAQEFLDKLEIFQSQMEVKKAA